MKDQPNNPTDAEREVFLELLRCESAEERSVFLDRVCANDPTIRVAVETLLQHHKEDEFMQPPGLRSAPLAASEKPGVKIGRYKLLQQVGEGGCGVVYMAEQEEPVRRQVALKVIKLGMDTKNVIARFEAERQALALMDHPNIAKVFDAGATETGRPYFVMELVRGIKITEYCDQNNLSTQERLHLFVQVCRAIQHAHQKGIIHRDIKPSNVLVTLRDGVPVPKVIDFGIAKATGDQRLTDKTLFTAFEQFIGTPAYMSPEQAEMSELGVDTRSDIYSLGVLLYELLTSQTPFDTKKLLEVGLDEIRRTIREQEPERPSTRLSTMLGADLTVIAKNRKTEPPKLIHLVRGDLDWIVMKALEKDRARRYETVNGLAADVQRHLNNEPVVACPPSNTYKFQKLIRRNKLAFLAAGAVTAALIIGLGVATWMFFQEKKAHEQTLVAEREQSHLREKAELAEAAEAGLRQQAEHLRLTAEDTTARLKRHLYASDMNMAFQAWEKGDLTRVDGLLDKQRPKAADEDMRGFEWYYLWRLCHSEQLTLRGHNALMRAVAFSPDGRLLATAGDDSTARIWDAQSGKELFALGGQSGGVTSLAFAPDGKTLATGGGDKKIGLWNVRTGEELIVLAGHNYSVTALAFSPDGKRLASAEGKLADDGDYNPVDKYVDTTPLPASVIVWDTGTWKPIQTLTGCSNSILSLAISPDGKQLATGSADATVKLWEVATGTLTTNLSGFKGPVFAVAFSPDGAALAVGGGDPYREQADLRILDLPSHAERITLKGHQESVFALAFSPDGKSLASGGLDQIVRLWDVITGNEVQSIRGHRASIWSLAWDPNGKRIASASWDHTVKIWDVTQPQGQEVFPGSGNYSGCFSPDGKYLIRASPQLKIYEPGITNPPFTVPDYKVDDLIVAMSPDGSILASVGLDEAINLWQTGTWRRLATLRARAGRIWRLAFSPDGRTLVSSDSVSVRLWDVTKRVERTVFHRGREKLIGQFFYTPNGRALIVSDEVANRSDCLDVLTGEVQKSFFGCCRALSPDGRYVAVDRSGLGLLDLKTMELKWVADAHRGANWTAQFASDGKTLATASWDGTAKLWNVASGQQMFTYQAPGVVWTSVFSKDGKWWSVGSGSTTHGEVALFRGATPSEVDAVDSPAIVVQPVSQTSAEGKTVIFEMSTTGAPPLSYQWRKGSDSLANETNDTLKLTDVTTANAGDYSVVVANTLGSATSCNATLSVFKVQEEPMAEINFRDKQPAWYHGYTYCENPVPLSHTITVAPGAGVGGGAGLVMQADASAFTNNMRQANSGFGLTMASFTTNSNGVNTTNLGLYKLYATVRSTGLIGKKAIGRIAWQFWASHRCLLGLETPATFTTNFQTYSFILSDGTLDPENGSWSDFMTEFNQINAIQFMVVADDWLGQYAGASNAFYVSNVRFVRLTPATPLPPGGVAK